MTKIIKNSQNRLKCQSSRKMPKITENAQHHQKCQLSPKKKQKTTEND